MTFTAEMFAPLTTAINDVITLLLPVGLGVMATMLGISFIPKIINKFA